MDNSNIKLIHEWTVSINKEVDETGPEIINGQTVQVTRKVNKEVETKFAIKLPTRRELKAAELFYGKEFNRFFSMGFMPRSIIVNKHMDLSGGVMSEKERNHIADLFKKSVDLEGDLARMATVNGDDAAKKLIEAKLAAIRSEIVNVQMANESVFSQTADARAQSQLNTWFALFLTVVFKDGKFTPYFEGESFEQKEEFMWGLEDKNDELYNKAVSSISKHINIFISGGDTPEKFKKTLEWVENEAKKQLNSGELAKDAAPKPAATEEAKADAA